MMKFLLVVIIALLAFSLRADIAKTWHAALPAPVLYRCGDRHAINIEGGFVTGIRQRLADSLTRADTSIVCIREHAQ